MEGGAIRKHPLVLFLFLNLNPQNPVFNLGTISWVL